MLCKRSSPKSIVMWGQRLDHCKNGNHDLSRKLFEGLNDVDTKFSELTIDDMFIKMLQQGVEST